MPALNLSAAPTARAGNFVVDFLKGFRGNLLYYFKTLSKGKYLGHTIVLFVSEVGGVTGLVLKGRKVVGYRSGLEKMTDAPTPKASSAIADLTDTENNVIGQLLRPFGIHQPTRVAVLYGLVDQHLWLFLNLERAINPQTLLSRVSREPATMFGEWAFGNRQLTWQAFDQSLEPSSLKDVSAKYVVAGIASESCAFYEGWAAGAKQELYSIYPVPIAVLTFFKNMVWAAGTPAFGVIVTGERATIAYWNGSEIINLFPLIEAESIGTRAYNIFEEIGRNGGDVTTPTPMYIFARRDEELSEENFPSTHYDPGIETIPIILLTSEVLRNELGPVGSDSAEASFEAAPQPECWLMQWVGKTLK